MLDFILGWVVLWTFVVPRRVFAASQNSSHRNHSLLASDLITLAVIGWIASHIWCITLHEAHNVAHLRMTHGI